MGSTAVHIVDWLLWAIMAFSVVYPLVYSLASLLPARKRKCRESKGTTSRFLVLFPAYKEDAVIVHAVETFLQQDYPQDAFCTVVISDHMQPSTNNALSALPVTLLKPVFEKSSKGRALHYAISQLPHDPPRDRSG